MLYGIENNSGGPPNTSKGGTLDLYFWESNNQSIGTGFTANDLLKRGQGGSRNGPSGSSRPSEYAGFTCPLSTAGCTFLARFDLGAGADLNSQIKTIINPAGTSTYDSYLQVDHSVVGNWTDSLDGNFFTLNPAKAVCGYPLVSCRQANDMRSRGEFTHAGAEVWDVAGTDIIGLAKLASTQAFVVSAPAGPGLFALVLAMALVQTVWCRAKAGFRASAPSALRRRPGASRSGRDSCCPAVPSASLRAAPLR